MNIYEEVIRLHFTRGDSAQALFSLTLPTQVAPPAQTQSAFRTPSQRQRLSKRSYKVISQHLRDEDVQPWPAICRVPTPSPPKILPTTCSNVRKINLPYFLCPADKDACGMLESRRYQVYNYIIFRLPAFMLNNIIWNNQTLDSAEATVQSMLRPTTKIGQMLISKDHVEVKKDITEPVKWTKPQEGFLKLNVDVSNR
nr:uncharacterized protein LOC109155085 [Ipomoea batatas]